MVPRLAPSTAARSLPPVEGVLETIGKTPLVRLLRYLRHRPDIELWAKLEAFNPGGSAKDRPAAWMLDDALAEGLIDSASTTQMKQIGRAHV